MVLKGALRAVKNVTNGYSDAEAKVRTITSNDSVLPSGAQMHELAQLSHNQGDFIDIVTMLDKRLNDKGKYWRHVYKSLSVLEYLLHSGSPKVAQYFRDNIYLIKTLTEFQHIDDTGRDVGADVRARARELSKLLADDKNLAEARRRRKRMRDRMAGRKGSESDDEPSEAPQRPKKPSREEQDVQRALKLSEQDEVERRRRIAEQGKNGLFDEPKPEPSNLIDLSVDESQPWQLQPQVTSLPPQMTTASYGSPALQAQFTTFDPYAQQAQYEAMLQAEYMRQQAEAAEQQQQQHYYLQFQAAQYQAAQLQASQQSLVPQKTAFGSNNPFATNNPFGQSATPPPIASPQIPQFTSPARSDTSTPALVQGRPASSASASSRTSSLPPRTPVSARAPDALSAVLASAGPGGVDSFGNVGSLRFGGSSFGRMAAQRATAAPH
jgi:epsin